MAVVLPTWLLCWGRFTHSIVVQVFLPDLFQKRKASESDRGHSSFLLVCNFYSSKRLLRNRVCSHLSSSADFRKAFEDLSHKNRKDERSQTDLVPTTMSLTLSNPPGSETKNSRDHWNQSVNPKVQSPKSKINQIQKEMEGFPARPSGWDSALPLQAPWFPSAVWELRPHLPPCLVKNGTNKIHRTCR